MFEANPSIRRLSNEGVTGDALTFNGVINRTGALLLVTGVTFAFTWRGLMSGDLPVGVGMIGSIVGLVLALVIIFTRATNPILIGAYAVTQGLGLGVISYFANLRYPGIAVQAVGGTLACFTAVLWLYSMRVLRATPMFTKVIIAGLIGAVLVSLFSLIGGHFNPELNLISGGSTTAIVITAVMVLIAALSFVIDFDAIETAVNEGADARYGWHFAFTLLLGLVYLYIQVLRLLSNLRSRN